MKHSYYPELDRHIERCAEKEEEIGDVMCQKFVQDLNDLRVHFMRNVNLYTKMKPKDIMKFQNENPEPNNCQWCKKEDNNLMLHHDHNKKEDNIIAYICNSCNQLEAKNNRALPIIFHNLPYDLMVLINGLKFKNFILEGEEVKLNQEYNVMAKTNMKYSTLSFNQVFYKTENKKKLYLPEVRFIDSYAFINMSLSSIVDNLKQGQTKEQIEKLFKNTKERIDSAYPSIKEELFNLSTEKGIIAYSHTTIENMNSKTNLPIEFIKMNSISLKTIIQMMKKELLF
jgi:hypothetical protein